MRTVPQGSFRIAQIAGIDLFLHWSWFLVAAYEIRDRRALVFSAGGLMYSSLTWKILEYLALFLIVLLHEFGHALACRQVGGTANRIVLWPLGGVAYVNPPPRPGATLWSIAAGPLVNVVLLPILLFLSGVSGTIRWSAAMPDAHLLAQSVLNINGILLVFNLLPIYPLDGGQILRSLLWFMVGRAKSLMAAVILGFMGVAGMIALAVWMRSIWYGVLGAFILLNCWGGLRQAQALAKLAKLPRREGFACPSCKAAPLLAPIWKCDRCLTRFDPFETRAVCPGCGVQHERTACPECRALFPISEWFASAPAHSR
jgi:Zn-dependent protease